MTDPIVIGFAGKLRSGKTTAAMRLVENWSFERIRFAGALKELMYTLGLSEEEVEGSLKETPCDLLCGRTPRHAMQTIGTEWGRHLIGEDFWIRVWARKVENYARDAAAFYPIARVVADDVRFTNEAAVIKAMGGVVIRVYGGKSDEITSSHSSEDGDFPVDYQLFNDGSIEHLQWEVDGIAAQITERRRIDQSWADEERAQRVWPRIAAGIGKTYPVRGEG